MPSDLKRRGKKPKKRSFNGNQWIKIVKTDTAVTFCARSEASEEKSSASNQQQDFCWTEDETDSATRSLVKLHNLYNIDL